MPLGWNLQRYCCTQKAPRSNTPKPFLLDFDIFPKGQITCISGAHIEWTKPTEPTRRNGKGLPLNFSSSDSISPYISSYLPLLVFITIVLPHMFSFARFILQPVITSHLLPGARGEGLQGLQGLQGEAAAEIQLGGGLSLLSKMGTIGHSWAHLFHVWIKFGSKYRKVRMSQYIYAL